MSGGLSSGTKAGSFCAGRTPSTSVSKSYRPKRESDVFLHKPMNQCNQVIERLVRLSNLER